MIDLRQVCYLLHRIYPGPFVDDVFVLRDVKSGSKTPNTHITGRAQYAMCGFCRKGLCSWGARPASKRSAAGSYDSPERQKLNIARIKHVHGCAEKWLRAILCRWSTRTATMEEFNAVAWWREQHMAITPDEIAVARHRHGAWAHNYIAPPYMTTIFDNLPQPMGSPIVDALEVLLQAHVRLVELGMRARIEAEETFARECQERSTISG